MCDAVRYGSFGLRDRVFERLRAIVQPVQKMVVHIKHELSQWSKAPSIAL
jgi:hypothetical protein